uniref:Uncharacterized protein n=1 Tax=Rhizophora mucronata TaxID=61149 RepID=A0A2P2Q693_RHIMU
MKLRNSAILSRTKHFWIMLLMCGVVIHSIHFAI